MIAPEKTPRRLASNDLAYGLSVYELCAPLFVPFILIVFFGIDKIIALSVVMVVYFIMIMISRCFEKNFLINVITKKKRIKTEKIRALK